MTKTNEKRMNNHRIMNWPGAALLCFLLVSASLSVHGCGGTFYSVQNQGEVAGTWNLVLTQPGVPTVRATQLTIRQDKRYDPFSGTTNDNATLTGTLNINDVSITLNNPDGTLTTLTGTASSDWNSFSGTYTSTGTDGSGTWTADRNLPPPTVAPLSITPPSATLSCTGSTGVQFLTFSVKGGTRSSYSVVATTNQNLVTITDTNFTTTGFFTVTATTCPTTSGTVVSLTVSDSVSNPLTVLVTIQNP